MSMAALLFEAVTGLAVTFLTFHAAIEWGVLLHTLAGVALLVPTVWYCVAHWLDYRRQALSDTLLLGYVGLGGLLVCSLSGLVVTWQGLFGIRTSAIWRNAHLISTLLVLGAVLAHLVLAAWREIGRASCRERV